MRANVANARNFLSRWYNSRRTAQDFWLRSQGRQKVQPDKSTAFARTTSLHVGRQVTFGPGADVMAAALTEHIHLLFTA
jgi:hypothetical protein